MLGAIAGDIIGSVYEAWPTKSKSFPLFSSGSRFTDDTVLSVAVADCILHGGDYARTFQDYVRRYPDAGYGGTFIRWALSGQSRPYGSWGNGSAMRVSPVGWAFESSEAVLEHSMKSAAVTHDHPEGIKGAQATALTVFLARSGVSRDHIRRTVTERFDYDLTRSVVEIRPHYGFDVSCQGSVPESLICALESQDFEDAVRNAVSLGGDADTMACIAGAVAEALYGGVPRHIESEVDLRLDDSLRRMLARFRAKFACP